MTGFGALPGSISLLAAGSGGAMIDFAATSGVAGEGFAGSGLTVSAFAASTLATRPLPIAFAVCFGRSPPLPLPAWRSPLWRRRSSRHPLRRSKPPPGGLRGGGVDLSAAGAVAGAVATGATAGGLRALGGLRLRRATGGRGRSGTLPGDGAGDGIQSLFQGGDAGIQPVAIAVERIDGGGEPPRLVLAFLGDHWICCACRVRSAAATWSRFSRARTGWPSRPGSRRRPRRRPRSRAATARGGRTRLPRPADRSARRRCHPPRSRREMVGIFGQASLALLKALPNHRANINRKCAVDLNPEVCGVANRFPSPGENT